MRFNSCFLFVAAIPAIFLTMLQSKLLLGILQSDDVRYFYHTADIKDIALTIDDGPHPNKTKAILDILKKHNVKATFFLIGLKVKQYPDVVKRIVTEGHQIANHDYLDMVSALRRSSFEANFDKTHDLLRRHGSVNVFRPGCGLYASWMTDYVKSRGYKTILGNVYPHDVVFGRTFIGTTFLKWFLPWRVSPGSIVILHDGRPSLMTEEVLDSLIPTLKSDGYTFRTISEMESRYGDV